MEKGINIHNNQPFIINKCMSCSPQFQSHPVQINPQFVAKPPINHLNFCYSSPRSNFVPSIPISPTHVPMQHPQPQFTNQLRPTLLYPIQNQNFIPVYIHQPYFPVVRSSPK